MPILEAYYLRGNPCQKNKFRNIISLSSKMAGLTQFKKILAPSRIKWRVRGVVQQEVVPKTKAL